MRAWGSLLLLLALAVAPLGAAWGQSDSGGFAVTAVQYEGWRQYNAQCARCHGQDVLGNPVAANLLTSTAPGGPVAGEAQFVQVVKEGRASKGMPGFAETMTSEQIAAVYAYVKGRAEKKLPAGRPTQPKGDPPPR